MPKCISSFYDTPAGNLFRPQRVLKLASSPLRRLVAGTGGNRPLQLLTE